MAGHVGPPEIPYPWRPGREPVPGWPGHDAPRQPAPVPMVAPPSSEPQRRLFERRTLLVAGPLEGPAITRLSAELMALDGRSGDDVELVVNSPGGPLVGPPVITSV